MEPADVDNFVRDIIEYQKKKNESSEWFYWKG